MPARPVRSSATPPNTGHRRAAHAAAAGHRRDRHPALVGRRAARRPPRPSTSAGRGRRPARAVSPARAHSIASGHQSRPASLRAPLVDADVGADGCDARDGPGVDRRSTSGQWRRPAAGAAAIAVDRQATLGHSAGPSVLSAGRWPARPAWSGRRSARDRRWRRRRRPGGAARPRPSRARRRRAGPRRRRRRRSASRSSSRARVRRLEHVVERVRHLVPRRRTRPRPGGRGGRHERLGRATGRRRRGRRRRGRRCRSGRRGGRAWPRPAELDPPSERALEAVGAPELAGPRCGSA